MSVYNGAKYLQGSIESILNQTFNDFEFLIIDDGSSDNNKDIILSYNDNRIRLICNIENIGLTKSLNKSFDFVKSEYIARMDVDDISLPDRLETQVEFMDSNPEISVCGSWIKIIGTQNNYWKYPVNDEEIKAYLLLNNSMVHPSVIIRSSIFNKNNIQYNESLKYTQDYDLWERKSKVLKFANIPKVLLHYRINTKTNQKNLYQKNVTDNIRIRQLIDLGLKPTNEDLVLHNSLASLQSSYSKEKIVLISIWIIKIIKANEVSKKFNNYALKKILTTKYFEMCKASTRYGMWTWHRFMDFPYCKLIKLSRKERFKFLIKCAIKF